MIEAYLNLLIFVILMVGTPGPANLLVMIGGARHGVGKCAGFIFGLIGGKLVLNIGFGIGLGLFLTGQPLLLQILKFASAGYMIWLAVRSWPRSLRKTPTQQSDPVTQFRFRDGVIVHPLNPKAWLMVVLAWGNFAPAVDDFTLQLPVVIGSFVLCQLLFHSLWCGLGAYLGRSLADNHRLTKILILLTIFVVLTALFHAPST